MARKEFTAESITQDLVTGTICDIPGIGKLRVTEKAARKGRNPATGAEINIPAQKSVKFAISSVLKKRLNGG